MAFRALMGGGEAGMSGEFPSLTAGLDAGRRQRAEEGPRRARRPAALVSVYRIKDSDTRSADLCRVMSLGWLSPKSSA